MIQASTSRHPRTRSAVVILAALLGATPVIPAVAASQGMDAAMEVNGEAVPQAALRHLTESQMRRGKAPNRLVLEEQVRQELIARTVLSQRARESGLDQRTDVQAQNFLNEQAVLSQAYLQDYRQGLSVSDAEIAEAYEDFKAENQDMEYRVRHIVTKKEEDALAAIAALNRGESFDAMAKTNSIEPSADKLAGEIGWLRPDQLPDRAFAEAVKRLSKGEFSQEPVKTDYGWHVIKVEDGPRPLQFPPLDMASAELLEALRERVLNSKVSDHIRGLVDSAEVRQ